MAYEIEAKFRVDDHEPLRRRLRGLGAECRGCALETNRIFDLADGSLRRRGCGLRIRNVAAGDGGISATLTFKGQVEGGLFKSRVEHEIGISDATEAAVILEALGYVEILAYEKRRESWDYRGCRIELDQPPAIGLFVEIEGADERAICGVRDELGLEHAVHEKASYVRMMMEFRQRSGLPNRLISIENGSA